MAIYHLSAKPVQRSQGRSSTAAAAYRSGEKIHDERLGQTFDFTRKQRIEHTEIITKSGEKIDRSSLWNMAEKAERRKDGTTAREYEIALPSELNEWGRLELVRAFAKELAEKQGCAVDFAIHAPSAQGDERNFHAHVLCTTREFSKGQLGKKCAVELSDRDRKKRGLQGRKTELVAIRERYADMVNKRLEYTGHSARVDHRSLKKQGVDRQPTIHLGVSASAMERRGVRSDRGDFNRSTGKTLQALSLELDINKGIQQARDKARAWAEQQKKQEASEQLRLERLELQRKQSAERAQEQILLQEAEQAHERARVWEQREQKRKQERLRAEREKQQREQKEELTQTPQKQEQRQLQKEKTKEPSRGMGMSR